MRVLDFFKKDESADVDNTGEKEEPNTTLMDEREFIDFAFQVLLNNRVVASGSHSQPFSTQEEWDRWNAWAGRQGKMARTLRTLSKTTMSYVFKGDDDDALKDVRDMATNVHLRTALIKANKDWLKYGRCFIEPNWEITMVAGKETARDLNKVKVPMPSSMKVFRDNKDSIDELESGWRDLERTDKDYLSTVEVGRGDEVIGYVQHWNGRHEKKAVFFEPGEMIFIPREPDEVFPDGVALPAENYTNLMNKWGIEKSQAIMAKRFTDPKMMFGLGKEWWQSLKDVKRKIEASGLKAGTDFYYPQGVQVDIAEVKSSGMAVVKAQEHLENQVNAGTGFADSFTESASSNKSVGEVQMQFFERDIRPDRAMFAEVLMDELIIPFVVGKGHKAEATPIFVFEDLTPEDEIEKAKALTDYLPYMNDTQLRKLFKDLGYPIPDDEEVVRPPEATQLIANLASAKNLPSSVAISSSDASDELELELQLYKNEIAGVIGTTIPPATSFQKTKTLVKATGPGEYEFTEVAADGRGN